MQRKILKIARAFHPNRISGLATYLLKDEAVSGKFIIVATILALIAANTALHGHYESLWDTNINIGFGNWVLDKDLRHWVSEAFMAIFFLVVGLELKRELVRGELRRFRTAVLPFAAALGGMIVPAAVYLAFNIGKSSANGWAIPMATDIAFAIGILALVGKTIPSSIRLFLLTLAIVDDIGAVLVIALFYSQGINVLMLGVTSLVCIMLIALSRKKKLTMPIYIIGCVVIWLAINASGVHASIAGALMGLLAPLTSYDKHKKSISERAEHSMIPFSAFVVVPLFAFANTGIVLSLSSFENNGTIPIISGVIVGLVLGKVVGIVGASWIMIKLKYADLPKNSNWSHMIGVGFLAGIGFTVSIFVSELAFDQEDFVAVSKLGIFVASAISASLGLIVLKYNKKFWKKVSA